MTPTRFLIVDDDLCNNMLCHFMLEQATEAEIVDFTNPEDAIEYITSAYDQSTEENTTILLLDINMPQMTGWQFLEWFDTAPPHVKRTISIYMVSSSIDLRDKEKADANPYVKGLFTKPLQADVITSSIAM